MRENIGNGFHWILFIEELSIFHETDLNIIEFCSSQYSQFQITKTRTYYNLDLVWNSGQHISCKS